MTAQRKSIDQRAERGEATDYGGRMDASRSLIEPGPDPARLPTPDVVIDLSVEGPPWGSQPDSFADARPEPPPPAWTEPASWAAVPAKPRPKKPSVRLARKEPVGVGIRRLSTRQLDYALQVLADERISREETVHEVRKALRRIRGLLRLVRGELGVDRYRLENTALRDAGRLLSEARSAAVSVAMLESIEQRYSKSLRPGAFSSLHEALEERRLEAEAAVLDDPARAGELVVSLQSAQTRLAELGEIRDSFGALAPGLARTYRRGRRRMAAAYRAPSAPAFHEWRKRVRYLRFQMETLGVLWPDVLDGYAGALDRLGETLGGEHDLAELAMIIERHPHLAGGKRQRELLEALIEARRHHLVAKARTMGRLAYAEPTGRFVTRMDAYWSAWRD